MAQVIASSPTKALVDIGDHKGRIVDMTTGAVSPVMFIDSAMSHSFWDMPPLFNMTDIRSLGVDVEGGDNIGKQEAEGVEDKHI